MNKFKRGLFICVTMIVNYTLAAANMRFVARGNYIGTMLSDAAIAFVGWQLVKWVVDAETKTERAFYILGAMLGGMLGIRLT